MVIADSRPDIVPEVLDDRNYARWSSRVIAVVVDGFVLGGLVFLAGGSAYGTSTFTLPVPLMGSDGLILSGLSWGSKVAIFAAVLSLVLLQAYGGATPGKRIVGIAVVDDQTGRPVGLARTVLRDLAHLLDAILFIGYLRPLWHPEERTFADSLLGTVVLRTRTVRPNLLVARLATRRDGTWSGRPGARGTIGEPATGEWENNATGGVAVVSVVLACFCFPWTTAVSNGSEMVDCSYPILDSGSFVPTGVTIRADSNVSSERRLWVERTTTNPAQEVGASWTWHRSTAEPTTLELVVTGADGTQESTETVLPAGTPDGATDVDGTPLGDLTLGVSHLGPGWTAESSVIVGGQVVSSCSLTV